MTNSVVVLVVRKGNPKNIKGWDDLAKPGVEVIAPNPFTSGGAKWNIMAAYGAQLKQGKSEDEAKAYLKELFDNVPVQDKSAREALQTFTGGKGDVLLSYENEAITAQQAGEDVDYVVPAETILIQNPVAVTKDAAPPSGQGVLRLPAHARGAEDLRQQGLPPGGRDVAGADEFPTPPEPVHDRRLRRLVEGQRHFFDPDGSVMSTIEQDLGISTAK